MATSSEYINTTQASSLPFNFLFCIKGIHVGIVFYYTIASLCLVVGVPAHAWCLWFYQSKPVQVLPLNHTVLELIFCAESLAEMLNVYVFENEALRRVLIVCLCLTWIGRPLLQTCICIEQYLAVIHPITFLRYKDVRIRICVAASVHLLCFGYGLYKLETTEFLDLFMNVIFFLSSVVISFCCASVLCALKHPGPWDLRPQTGTGLKNQQKKNAFDVIFSALLIILFTYLPQLLIHRDIIKTNFILFECNIAPLIVSTNNLGVIITPLIKMYKGGHLKIPFRKNLN